MFAPVLGAAVGGDSVEGRRLTRSSAYAVAPSRRGAARRCRETSLSGGTSWRWRRSTASRGREGRTQPTRQCSRTGSGSSRAGPALWDPARLGRRGESLSRRGVDHESGRDAAAAAWHAAWVVRFLCSTYGGAVTGVRVNDESFIVITAECSSRSWRRGSRKWECAAEPATTGGELALSTCASPWPRGRDCPRLDGTGWDLCVCQGRAMVMV